MKIWLKAALLFIISAAAWAEARLEVIPLQWRSAEQVIPVIQSLVGPDGVVTGMQNKLIVRTTPERLAQIRQLLASLDSAPRRLMISVRMGGSATGEDMGAAVAGEIGPAQGVKAQVWSNRAQGERQDEQRLQVLEGNSAFIRTGTAVPFRRQVVTRDAWGRTVVQETTDYRDVDTGFEVVPRLAGDRVFLDIHPRRSRLVDDRSVAVEAAATTVSGRLGEWIELGGVNVTSEGDAGGIAYSTRGRDALAFSMRVKVELLP
ncbi:secretin N-terminal domain-containing protein [Thiobacter aerophilum]|uniref:Secretin N-terminal domain-containing protein n=1 Tax=Thiobacter aerophilum TaxID=3121275 RepID=A0ABV0EEH7_9BURK